MTVHTRFILAVLCLAASHPVFGQLDTTPKLNLRDTTITTRESLWFAPQAFAMGMCSYQSRYEILADGSEGGTPRFLIRITSREEPKCLSAAGFSGPGILFQGLQPGIHRLAFTDSSDFKLAIPNTVRIRVVEAGSPIKPPESTSKVKKVMLYNKIGGWVAVDGIAAVKAAFEKLAAAKGFELVQQYDDADITLDYLKQFQVIVWNNNTNGASSVPSKAARQAVLDYLDQGGGWMLIHGAGDHNSSWAGLTEAMGTVFYLTGVNGMGEVVLDSDGRAHRELKWMMDGFPDVFSLSDRWFSFRNTVRPLPGVTVVATARLIPGGPRVLAPMPDSSGDQVYIWAREVGRGRLLYNSIGFGMDTLMAQQDSIVPRLYWQNLRYAAGDFQNGCTDAGSPGFDPAARVHVPAMCSSTGIRQAQAPSRLVLSHGGTRIRLASPGGPLRARLRDLRGALVWQRDLPAGTVEIALDGALRPGVYHIELRGPDGVSQRRLALP